MVKNENSIDVEIFRKNGKTYFEYNIHAHIEKIFKDQAEEERESESWKNIKFYHIPKMVRSESYKDRLSSYNLFDSFGQTFYKDNKANIAWLRTVGGSGKIEIDDVISFSEMTIMIKNIIAFTKDYFENYVNNAKVTGTLKINIGD